MIRKIFDSTIQILKDPARSFKDRVFVVLTLITDFVITLALVGDIIFGESMVEIVALAVTIVLVPIITFIAIKKHAVVIAVRVIIIGLIVFVLPLIYYFGGGLSGGGVIWIVFVYLYTGLVLSGKWKPLVLMILTLETVAFYVIDYLNPGKVRQHDRTLFFADSLISVTMVGIVCCLMVWFVEWLFQTEKERALEEARKYEELNKSQNRFFSSMSHEIRTPINSILGLNEIILRQEDASEEIIKDAENIKGAGRMLLALVNDILDFSKIEAGKMDIVPVNYSVASLVSEIVNMIWLRAEQKGLEFKVEIDPNIPKELFGDEVRIKQILINLLNNAVKYTKEGTVTLHMEKEDIKEDSVRLMFSVSDTGMGIKQDALPYLFDAFRRVDEEKNRNIEGTGLGLSIVKQLVDLMDGEVSVNSVYMQGSTFTVSLWQKISDPYNVGEINISNYGGIKNDKKYEAGFTASDARVLIVDDNEMNLEVEKKLLEGTLISVDLAGSGDEALALTSKRRYDVILMDHLMPEMDGIECLQMIRKQADGFNNHTPVIVLTANAGSENKELYSNSGFDGYLLKPVSGQQLEAMLLKHLPEAKVNLKEASGLNVSQMSSAKGYSRKIPVVVATSSMCDLPVQIVKENQIDIIPFKVLLDGKEYLDGVEADADEILKYMREDRDVSSNPPTVEEFEAFFAGLVRKAHQVIYITSSALISEEHKRATEAVKSYGNVYIFNSGLNSSALGLLVLFAYRMTVQGMSPTNIIAELEKLKKCIHCSFIASDPSVLYRRGLVGRYLYEFMRTIAVKPFVLIKDDIFSMRRFSIGEMDISFDKYVDYALPRNINPDLDLVFITYSNVSEKMLKHIEERVWSRYRFKNIIFQKASAVMSLSCGEDSFGIMYVEMSDHPYNLEKLVSTYHPELEEVDDEDEEDNENEETSVDYVSADTLAKEIPPAPEVTIDNKWYDNIPGIDIEVALTNSGSEDSFKSVLEIFYNYIDIKADEISGFYDSEDWENYTIKVHALKSSARLIGATKLSKDAEALEMAGKEGNLELIRERTDALLRDLRAYKEPLSEIFGEEQEEEMDEEAEKAPRQSSSIDDMMIQSLYDALSQGVSERNEASLKGTFSEAEGYAFPEEHAKKLTQLKELFEASDYAGMEEILKEYM